MFIINNSNLIFFLNDEFIVLALSFPSVFPLTISEITPLQLYVLFSPFPFLSFLRKFLARYHITLSTLLNFIPASLFRASLSSFSYNLDNSSLISLSSYSSASFLTQSCYHDKIWIPRLISYYVF